MAQHERNGTDHVEDLDLPEHEADDVTGGALNAYIAQVKGEKQGSLKGGTEQARQITVIEDV